MITGMIMGTPHLESEKEVRFIKKPEIQVRQSYTAAYETPTPIDLGRAGIFAASTGQLILMQAADSVIRHATRYIKDIAVLPIDEHDDEAIDQLMSQKLGSLQAKPLTRKI